MPIGVLLCTTVISRMHGAGLNSYQRQGAYRIGESSFLQDCVNLFIFRFVLLAIAWMRVGRGARIPSLL